MNTQPDRRTRKDGIVTAIGVLVLVIGAATGSAIALLVMALIGLAVIPILDRHQLGQPGWLLLMMMTVSAAIAAVTATMINILT